jgi:hypothetical protein
MINEKIKNEITKLKKENDLLILTKKKHEMKELDFL